MSRMRRPKRFGRSAQNFDAGTIYLLRADKKPGGGGKAAETQKERHPKGCLFGGRYRT